MTQNFNNAKIYKITNDYNDEVYIGSTCDTLTKRYSAHKSMSKDEKHINSPIYKLMNEIGVERFRIDLVEDYPCNDKMALRQREGHFIREIGTLNMKIAGRTKKEYNIDNADKIKEYNDERKEIYQEYYLKNQEQKLQKSKEHRIANIDKVKQYDIERNKTEKRKEQMRKNSEGYRRQNSDKLKEYSRLYRLKKKEEKLQEITN